MNIKVNKVAEQLERRPIENRIKRRPSTRDKHPLPPEISRYLRDLQSSNMYRNLALLIFKNQVDDDLRGKDTKYLYMYAITITPKGKNSRHTSYKKEFQEDLKTNRSFRFGWFYPESTNTHHYHGLVLCADKNVKFTVCKGRDKYVWLHEPVKNQKDWIKYICKPEKTIKDGRTLIVVKKE